MSSTVETSPVVEFEHGFFASMAQGYFRISEHTKEAAFMLPLDGAEAALSFRGIVNEFGLAPDSADGRMLELVGAGLRFVPLLRVGDPIPLELLTGEASWSITDEHRRVALDRLTLQLVSWWSGAEAALTDRSQLIQIAEDPAMRLKAGKAIDKAAEQLGLDRATIESRISQLGEDVAYVEALRERFRSALSMFEKVEILRRKYSDERSMHEIASAVARLMTAAVRMYREKFEAIDDQTSEILGALRNFEGQSAFIREARDDIYCRLLAWGDMLETWGRAAPKKGLDKPALLRDAYQFLAPRFMPSEQWILAGRLGPGNSSANGKRVIPNSLSW